MQLKSILFCALLSLPLIGQSQSYYSSGEFGVIGGSATYFGDLNDNYNFANTKPLIGAFGRYQFNPFISAKVSLIGGQLYGDDKLSSNPYNRTRNLNFKSNFFEFAVTGDFNFSRFSTGEPGKRFSPYLTGGIGVMYFDPYTHLNGKKYRLKPLGTEGQNVGYDKNKYSNFAIVFPVGAGVKYWLRSGMNVGLEITNRITLTDYIDDVSSYYIGEQYFPNVDPRYPNPAYALQDRSREINPNEPLGTAGKQRGHSETKDQYFTVMLSLSFQLKMYRCPAYMKGEW